MELLAYGLNEILSGVVRFLPGLKEINIGVRNIGNGTGPRSAAIPHAQNTTARKSLFHLLKPLYLLYSDIKPKP